MLELPVEVEAKVNALRNYLASPTPNTKLGVIKTQTHFGRDAYLFCLFCNDPSVTQDPNSKKHAVILLGEIPDLSPSQLREDFISPTDFTDVLELPLNSSLPRSSLLRIMSIAKIGHQACSDFLHDAPLPPATAKAITAHVNMLSRTKVFTSALESIPPQFTENDLKKAVLAADADRARDDILSYVQ